MDRHEPLAELILSKLGYGVKGALEGSSGVFRKGHSSRLYKRELTEPMLHARARV